MPVVQSSGFNQASLVVNDVYIVVARPANTSIQGVPTGIVGYVGGASWGPVNAPISFGSIQEAASNFGPLTLNPNDLMTDVAYSFQQGLSQGVGVRAADGTQAKAVGALSTAAFGTITLAGAPAAGNTVAAVLAGTSFLYTLVAGDTTAALAAASFAAFLNLNSTFTASYFATAVGAVVTITSKTASNTTTLTSPVTGGGVTAVPSAATLTGGGVAITNHSAFYTGTEGNFVSLQLVPGANTTLAVPTWTLRVARTGLAPSSEIYPNLLQSTLAASIVNALANGVSAQRGRSELSTAAAGSGTGAPAQTLTTLTGGLNGDTAITTSQLLGTNAAIPMTGMYALSEQGVQQFVLCGSTDSTAWTTAAAYGQDNGALAVFAFAPNTSTAAAVALKKSAGIDTEYAVFVKDWVQVLDTQNNVVRMISPAAMTVGKIASLTPEQSPENKSMVGVLATERTLSQVPYLANELAQLINAGILVITNPCPGGSFFGLRHGMNASSNSATNGIEWTRMTNFIAYSLNTAFGEFIGKNQSSQPGDPVRANAETKLRNFFGKLKQQGTIQDFSVDMEFGPGKTNTRQSVEEGFMIAKVKVTYLGVVRFFTVMLVGGKTVQVSAA